MRKPITIWRVIFVIYILMILNFIVLKFTGSTDSVLTTIQNNMRRRSNGEIGATLVPFRTISIYISDLKYGIGLKNILGNIIPFIPMGFIIPMAFPALRNFTKTMILCFLIIFSVEILQFFSFLGIFDIDDIILNLFSCFIGYVLLIICRKILRLL